MTKFSERIGITQSPKELQLSAIDDTLRNSLWNVLVDALHSHVMNWYGVLKILYADFFKRPIDDLPNDQGCRFLLRALFNELEWYDVYNLTEFIIQNIQRITDGRLGSQTLESQVNAILERELSAYRSINLELVPISSEPEIQSIRDATSAASTSAVYGVSEHLNSALRLLGKKPHPDYRNSIKESICALEAICKVTSGESAGGLDKALSNLSTAISLHPAFKAGILKLYGYTSDQGGIRHAMLEVSNVGFDEAKFMLVACSALVNFLIAKSKDAGLL